MEENKEIEEPKKSIKKKDSLLFNIIINNFYQILILIVPLITTPYISRVLTSSGVGIYSYTNSFVIYFTMIAALGTLSYGTREIARRRDNKKELSQAFWEIEIITVLTSLICIIGWIIFSFMYTEYSRYLYLWIFSIIAVIFDISWLYAGVEKFKYTVSINGIFKVLSCILIFIFVKDISDTNKYIMIFSVSTLLGNLSMWLFLPKIIVKAKPNIKQIGYHFKQTLIYFIPTIATTIYTVLDKTLIGIITNNDDYNGQYESATKIINLCKTIGFSAIVGVITSRSSYLFKINDYDKIKRTIMHTFNIVSFLCIPLVFGLISIADIFVPLFFGEGYDLTVTMIYILSPLIFIISLSNVCGGLYYTPSGKRLQSSIYLIIGSIINLILNIILINLMGPLGACVSTIIAESIISIFYVSYCKYISWVEIFNIIWKKLLAGIVMFAAIYYFSKIGIDNSYIDLIFRFLIGISVYFICLILLRDKIFSTFKKIKE